MSIWNYDNLRMARIIVVSIRFDIRASINLNYQDSTGLESSFAQVAGLRHVIIITDNGNVKPSFSCEVICALDVGIT